MERTKNLSLRILLMSILIAASMSVIAQKSTDPIYSYYINEEMDKWKMEIDRKQTLMHNAEELNALCFAEYGYIGYLMGIKKKDEARITLAKAHKHIDIAIAQQPDFAAYYAIKAAYYGFEIGLYPYKAPFIGPKSIQFINKALELNKKEPMAWIVLAGKNYYMPGVFGGSKKEGIKNYEKAIQLFEENKNTINNWQYLNAMAILGTWYTEEKHIDKAEAIFHKTLFIEPNFKWVKEKLLPELNKLN